MTQNYDGENNQAFVGKDNVTINGFCYLTAKEDFNDADKNYIHPILNNNINHVITEIELVIPNLLKHNDMPIYSLLSSNTSYIEMIKESQSSPEQPMSPSNLSFPSFSSSPDNNNIPTKQQSNFSSNSKICTDFATLFDDLLYLGSVSIDEPKERSEIIECMKLFDNPIGINFPMPLKICMAVPDSCRYSIILYERGTRNEISRFKVSRIMFCARGEEGTSQQNNFAFTCSQSNTEGEDFFKCHIFKCLGESPEGTGDILLAFAKAFRKPEDSNRYLFPIEPDNNDSSSPSFIEPIITRAISVSLEIKEEVNKDHFSICPLDNDIFKLRQSLEKRFNLTVRSFPPDLVESFDSYSSGNHNINNISTAVLSQRNSTQLAAIPNSLFPGLVVERCFGIHITPGSDFNQNKLHLLDIVSMNHAHDNQYIYNISVLWDPKEYKAQDFIQYNSNKDQANLTFILGLDLIFSGIQEPIRLLLNVRGKLYPDSEKFWYYLTKQRHLRETYYVELKRDEEKLNSELHVCTVKSHSQITRNYANDPVNISQNISATQTLNYAGSNGNLHFNTLNNFLSQNGNTLLASIPNSWKPLLINNKFQFRKTPSTPEEDNDIKSDNDEPLLSGTGEIKKDCEFSELETWAEILTEWRANVDKRPKKIPRLCQKGIPDALRGEVWQLLAKTHEDQDKMDSYKDLLTKESVYEKVIASDINRTFPAHEYFKRPNQTTTPIITRVNNIPQFPATNKNKIQEESDVNLENIGNRLCDGENETTQNRENLCSAGKRLNDCLGGDMRPDIADSTMVADKDINDTHQISPICDNVPKAEMNNKIQNSQILDISNENKDSCGQECLYRLIKAYSVYDTEIGYCQGLSFLAASLLLHMPEEQAFCLLVKIMYEYDLRNLFKQGFQVLQLKFYQLERILQENLPALYSHFNEIGIEVHMFASQWFLTIFTAKFPLNIVFNILDVFLCQGMNTIFCVSLALLKMSEKELLNLDFEEVLKFFRVNLPKKFRNQASAHKMMDIASFIKISNKKLKKYEKEYLEMKEKEMFEKDPVEILKKENSKLKEAYMRLERENDHLAQELVSSKIRLRTDLDATEDTAESLSLELEHATKALKDTEEDNKRLLQEIQQVKQMCRRELQKYETEALDNEKIMDDYKQINNAKRGRRKINVQNKRHHFNS
ncbi:rab GTPase-activating protein 1-like isoform X1 [Gordionus sp. m RMFG-2023]|uniref:rab GTPase-activating protein 1-like isoform X1 n=1 Tax=Gordionus sp. m RMFG-2023 TaxID=3053472 RepID=UPI0031FBF86E